MPFPSDYKRVQHAGGVTADVSAHVGIARQILVDTSKQKLYLMDGSLAGGRGVFMDSEFTNAFLASPQGTLPFIENGTDGAADDPRLWKSSVLKSAFAKVVDTTTPSAWLIKDAAMPDTMRDSAKVISDLNLAVETGHYRCDPSATSNLPGVVPTGTSVNLMMIVVAQSSTELMQMLWIRDGSGRRWVRQCVAGVFGSWIIDTGLTSVDIAGKLDKTGGVMSGDLDMGAQDIKNGFMLTGTSTRFADPVDQTKKVQWNLVPITTGNTRIITMPNKDIELKDQAWELISKINISGNPSVIDFTNLSAYETLRVSGYHWSSLDATTLSALFSTDNGATYPTGASHYSMAYIIVANSAAVSGGVNGQNGFLLTVAGSGTTNVLQSTFSGEFTGWNKSVVTFGRMQAHSRSSGNGYYSWTGGGSWTNGGAVPCNALRLALSAGTFAGGTIVLEGIKG